MNKGNNPIPIEISNEKRQRDIQTNIKLKIVNILKNYSKITIEIENGILGSHIKFLKWPEFCGNVVNPTLITYISFSMKNFTGIAHIYEDEEISKAIIQNIHDQDILTIEKIILQ